MIKQTDYTQIKYVFIIENIVWSDPDLLAYLSNCNFLNIFSLNKPSEKSEKKKAKQSKSLLDQSMVNGKEKGAKDLNTAGQSTQPPPPVGTTGPAKKSTAVPVKRKRAASRSESGK